MNKEDFLEIRDSHFKACEIFIINKGRCYGTIRCKDCPFNYRNAVNGRTCYENKYSKADKKLGVVDELKPNKLIVKSAKEFLKFKEENMKRENVLEIEFKEVFDMVAWRVTYQNEEVLKRGEFADADIDVDSSACPAYSYLTNRLYIRGTSRYEDNLVLLVTKEDAEKIKEKVDKINKKYGIIKRWRAEEGGRYYFIDSCLEISYDRDGRHKIDNTRYENGNYFRTEKECENKLKEVLPTFLKK